MTSSRDAAAPTFGPQNRPGAVETLPAPNDLEQSRPFLARFEAIDTAGFPEQEVLNQELMIRDLKMNLEAARFQPWEMPVDQFNGVHIYLPQLADMLAFESVKHYEGYISRLKLMTPPLGSDCGADAQKNGRGPHRAETPAGRSRRLANTPPEKSRFAVLFDKFPAALPQPDRKRLREAGLAAIRDAIIPADLRFTTFVRDEYAPKGRSEMGAWSLPDGVELPAFRVKESTTTDLTPEPIQQIGLEQVKQIEGRMLSVVKQMGYPDLNSFSAALKTNANVHALREEILDLYRQSIDQIPTMLPDLFGHLPKGRLDVLPIEEFRENEASTQYQPGTDGSRKAHVKVNTRDHDTK